MKYDAIAKSISGGSYRGNFRNDCLSMAESRGLTPSAARSCYDFAYERAHADGHGEVLSFLVDVIDLVRDCGGGQ